MSKAPRPVAARAATVHLFPGQGDFGLGPLLRTLPAAPSLRRALAEVFEEADRAVAELGVAPVGPRLAAATPPSARELASEMPGTLQLAQFGRLPGRAPGPGGGRADRRPVRLRQLRGDPRADRRRQLLGGGRCPTRLSPRGSCSPRTAEA
ncbi:hypothetical protein GCM10020229_15590 [Kitasatospora albolonga]|uniref:hypothetical protein n=1 Tax=Kitasatospora albolonga TaxID=68173 RepID=UPI0031ED00CC